MRELLILARKGEDGQDLIEYSAVDWHHHGRELGRDERNRRKIAAYFTGLDAAMP